MMGMAYAGYGLHLATEDIADKDGKLYPKITGNGPSNFESKKNIGYQWVGNLILLHKKNEDGSITYKQYNRMDPRFYIFGLELLQT